MTLFGLEITGDHARLITLVATSLFAVLGFVAGRWSKHRNHMQFQREDLVASTLVTEFYGLQQGPDGHWTLHIITHGRSEALIDAFTNRDLTDHIRRAAQKHPGLVQLKQPVAHRMMMDEGKDRITGNDAKATLDFVQGRPTREDDVLFGFAAYKETGERKAALHNEIARLVQMVVALKDIPRLADAEFIKQLGVPHAGYRPRTVRLHDFALEWRRLEALPPNARQSATDKIWHVTVRTSVH